MARAMDKTSSGSVMRNSPGAEDLSLLFRVVDGMHGVRQGFGKGILRWC